VTEKKKRRKYNKNDGNLTAVVGWPAIFAPGYRTSRNHPACKKKLRIVHDYRYRQARRLKTTFFQYSSIFKAKSKCVISEIIARPFS
jgi:hypothetical protein